MANLGVTAGSYFTRLPEIPAEPNEEATTDSDIDFFTEEPNFVLSDQGLDFPVDLGPMPSIGGREAPASIGDLDPSLVLVVLVVARELGRQMGADNGLSLVTLAAELVLESWRDTYGKAA